MNNNILKILFFIIHFILYQASLMNELMICKSKTGFFLIYSKIFNFICDNIHSTNSVNKQN